MPGGAQQTAYAWGISGRSRADVLRRRFPSIGDLRRRARRRVPRFSFDYVDGGAGGDGGVLRNAAALDAIELVPRYGVENRPVATEVTLFGRRYAAPLGIAPMGAAGLMWPGAEKFLASAAQRAQIPYTAGTAGGIAIEALAALAPDVLWFQLYRLPGNDHAVGFDLVRRAEAAGAMVLVLTLDVPVRSKRPRELRTGLMLPFRPTLHVLFQTVTAPAWLFALLRDGQPRFANFRPYAGAHARPAELAAFGRREISGAFTWDEVARFRERWPRPLVVKGILHPRDAERAVALGVDGIQVSNHGGRQIEGAPAAIDVLPAIAAAIGGRATVLFDGGVRCGLDIVRALARGARAAFVGRAFLYGVGALGGEGADYVADLLIEETVGALRQLGLASVEEVASVHCRHPGALSFAGNASE